MLRVLTDFSGVMLPYDIRRVAFFGQPVAVVVADTLEAATHGAALVEVRYTPGVQLTEHRCAAGGSASRHVRPTTPAATPTPRLRAAAVVTDGQYAIARNNHNPMELPSTVAQWDGDRLTVWDKVQAIVGAQEAHAEAHGVPADNVRVISPFVGGAFGSAGQIWPHQLLASFAARQMRRPVKLVLTRKQMYAGIGYRPTSRQRMAIGADRSGRIAVIVHEGTDRDRALRHLRRRPDRVAEVHVHQPEHALHLPGGAAGRQPADLHARARGDHAGRSRSSRRWTTWPTVSAMDPDRTAAPQRTRPRPDRRACRSPPAGSPSACAGAPTNSAGRGAIRRRVRCATVTA